MHSAVVFSNPRSEPMHVRADDVRFDLHVSDSTNVSHSRQHSVFATNNSPTFLSSLYPNHKSRKMKAYWFDNLEV